MKTMQRFVAGLLAAMLLLHPALVWADEGAKIIPPRFGAEVQVTGTPTLNQVLVFGANGVWTNGSEERRVGKECRSRWSPDHYKKKKNEKINQNITEKKKKRLELHKTKKVRE